MFFEDLESFLNILVVTSANRLYIYEREREGEHTFMYIPGEVPCLLSEEEGGY